MIPVAVCFFLAGTTGWNSAWPGWRYSLNAFWGFVGAFCFVALLVNIFEEKWGYGTRKMLYWVDYDIRYYEGSIPEFVLSKALEIQREVPTAGFSINQLTEKIEHAEAPPRRMVDPFLVVKSSNGLERYYIDVWNEKEYKL